MDEYVTPEQNVLMPLATVIGTFRTFGSEGPAYEIIDVAGPKSGANVQLRVRVVLTGEELDYPLNCALVDPIAQ